MEIRIEIIIELPITILKYALIAPKSELTMNIQTEPLDLSTKSKPSKLGVIDFKFLAGLNEHLVKLYEQTYSDGKKAVGLQRSGVKNVLPCHVCFKTFDRPSLLKRHMRTHTGEKPHICNVCSKGFSTSSSLNTHRRIHTGEKPHKCPECGKCFTASSNLYYHRMTHTKNKPHKCTVCPRSFPTPGELRAHSASHGPVVGLVTRQIGLPGIDGLDLNGLVKHRQGVWPFAMSPPSTRSRL